ncbi:MAG: hypothetical protein GX465_13045 [Acidobacteria bacterium]|nr:hypothetical protein [Acidobacteriota bacterium]
MKTMSRAPAGADLADGHAGLDPDRFHDLGGLLDSVAGGVAGLGGARRHGRGVQ